MIMKMYQIYEIQKQGGLFPIGRPHQSETLAQSQLFGILATSNSD